MRAFIASLVAVVLLSAPSWANMGLVRVQTFTNGTVLTAEMLENEFNEIHNELLGGNTYLTTAAGDTLRVLGKAIIDTLISSGVQRVDSLSVVGSMTATTGDIDVLTATTATITTLGVSGITTLDTVRATDDTVRVDDNLKLSGLKLALPSGHVTDWNDGDVTLTHLANALTLAGGAFTVGTFTSTGIDDNATAERVEIADTGVFLGTAANVAYKADHQGLSIGGMSTISGIRTGAAGSAFDISYNCYLNTNGNYKYIISSEEVARTTRQNGVITDYFKGTGTAGADISGWTVGMVRDNSGNVGIGTASVGASAAGVLAIANGTQGGALANAIQIVSEDLTSGNTQLSIRTEGGGAVDASGDVAASHRFAIKIDGTQYYILLTTVGP
jgi:hypothetical protein